MSERSSRPAPQIPSPSSQPVVAAGATLAGGCHCGAVRFQVLTSSPTPTDEESAALEVVECNCSICTKKGFLHWFVEPERFQLLQGEATLRTYRFNTQQAEHRFCITCGIHPFYRARSHPHHIDVNVRCLDAYHQLTAAMVVRPFDGANWEAHIAELQQPSDGNRVDGV